MPKRPGLPQKRNTLAITYQQILCLIERRNRIPGKHFRDESHRKEAWRNNKKAIMALQAKSLDIGEDSVSLQKALHRDVFFAYFERPLAFYEYDRSEILTGCTNKLTIGFKDYNTLPFGQTAYCSPEEKEVYALFGCQHPKAENAIIYNDQKQYLIENNLLNAAEKAILKGENA
jgi:hypothetical protein